MFCRYKLNITDFNSLALILPPNHLHWVPILLTTTKNWHIKYAKFIINKNKSKSSLSTAAIGGYLSYFPTTTLVALLIFKEFITTRHLFWPPPPSIADLVRCKFQLVCCTCLSLRLFSLFNFLRRWRDWEENTESGCSEKSADKWTYPVHIELLPGIVPVVYICPSKCLCTHPHTHTHTDRYKDNLSDIFNNLVQKDY